MKSLKKISKIIMAIILCVTFFKVKDQLISIYSYNCEISNLNDKINDLKEQIEQDKNTSEKAKENNEDIARKNLKMYYPNETPYKGY